MSKTAVFYLLCFDLFLFIYTVPLEIIHPLGITSLVAHCNISVLDFF